jgi:hypothetical protein
MAVTAANKKVPIDNHIEAAIKQACAKANKSTNSIRYGRKFEYINRSDSYTIQLRLQSDNSIIPTRAISSITRALCRLLPSEDLMPLKYNGSILNASLIEEHKDIAPDYNNMEPCEIVKTVIEVFFGQAPMKNSNKEAARKAAEQIRNIIIEYKNNTSK